jgi:hypothetical protein
MASKSAAAWFPGPPVLLVCTVCRSNRSASGFGTIPSCTKAEKKLQKAEKQR